MTRVKFCKDCNTTRSVDDFHKKQSSPDGRQRYCKTHQKQRAIVPMWRRAGITLNWDQFVELRDNHNNRCAVCKKTPAETREPEKELAVDHNAATGKIRGLLCMNCNTALGKLNHDIDLLKNAIAYLQGQG